MVISTFSPRHLDLIQTLTERSGRKFEPIRGPILFSVIAKILLLSKKDKSFICTDIDLSTKGNGSMISVADVLRLLAVGREGIV